MTDALTTTDEVQQHEPPSTIYEGTRELEIGPTEEFLSSLDDVDLYAQGLLPLHVGMLEAAIRQYRQGVRESGGANCGIPHSRYTQWFAPSSGCAPWCAYFVSWCLDRSTDANRRVPWTNPGAVASIHAWARSTGRLVSQPRTGDIFGLSHDHTGIVNNPDAGGGEFTSIEGNYSDKVASVQRRKAGLWFCRI